MEFLFGGCRQKKPASDKRTSRKSELLDQFIVFFSSRSSRFHRAVSNGDLHAIDEALKAGANPNKYEGQSSPLWVAVCNGRMDIAECLLKAGACADGGVSTCPLTGVKGTPLVIAVIRRRVDIVRVLLAAGADINHSKTNSRGYSALAFAVARGGSPDIVKLLYFTNPNVHACSLFAIAAKNEDFDTVDLLLSLFPSRPDHLEHALAWAAVLPSTKLVKRLMQAGAIPRAIHLLDIWNMFFHDAHLLPPTQSDRRSFEQLEILLYFLEAGGSRLKRDVSVRTISNNYDICGLNSILNFQVIQVF